MSISLDYRPLLEKFRELLAKRLGDSLVSIILYGSVARGDSGPDSDLDILVVVEDADADAANAVLDAKLGLERDPVCAPYRDPKFGTIPVLSCLTLTRSQAGQNRWLYLDMTEEAVFLFDRDDFFKKRLGMVKAGMERLGSRKETMPDGSWYWDLKPDLRAGEVFEL
ncbi:MAG: nucleotidyltransferase domain-containing protein [Elusimicrobia bacterium]|nr:nucleotidyltransferase domain-containing protein [Elusimicrobiota bacterium]